MLLSGARTAKVKLKCDGMLNQMDIERIALSAATYLCFAMSASIVGQKVNIQAGVPTILNPASVSTTNLVLH